MPFGGRNTVNTQTVTHQTDTPSTGDLRTDLERALEDACILVERVYREFYESGGPLEIERLLEKYRDLPWYLLKSARETTEPE